MACLIFYWNFQVYLLTQILCIFFEYLSWIVCNKCCYNVANRDCKIIILGQVGNIKGCFSYSSENFGLEALCMIGVMQSLIIEFHTSKLV